MSEVAKLINGFAFDSEHFARDEGIPLVRIRDLNSTDTEMNYVGPVVDHAWIDTNDVIVGMDGDFNVARWLGGRALLNQRMCCLRPRTTTDAAFVAYLLRFPLDAINAITYSTTVKHLSSADMRKIRFAEPPAEEQKAIARFLDRETAKLDALVAKKARLIELLLEKRSALIARAVRKGLDTTVEMMDSGVEWLGEIPAHWRVGKMWDVTKATSGATPSKETARYWDGGIPWVSPKDMKRRLIDSSEDTVTSAAMSEARLRLVPPGTVLVVVRGMILAHSLPVGIATVPVTINQDMKALSLSADLEPNFFGWWLAGVSRDLLALVVDDAAHGTKAIRMDVWRRLPVQIPPIQEQHAIASFLEHETTTIDALAAQVRRAIAHLAELRTALISAAVTGKIDVRRGGLA
jgi:type I restriction enzyme S subunit